MTDTLTRQAASDAVTVLGWRYVLGTVITAVRVASLGQAAEVAQLVAAADPAGSARLDLRSDCVLLTLHSPTAGGVTAAEVALAQRISTAVAAGGWHTEAGDRPRSVQGLEIAIDALDIRAVRPFWRAVLGYVDAGEDAVQDPYGQGPAVWFQQMDAPRQQRNRIHFDVVVGHDEAAGRIEAALAAGGRLLSDNEAPSFWVLADVEGNEACVCTWQGRAG